MRVVRGLIFFYNLQLRPVASAWRWVGCGLRCEEEEARRKRRPYGEKRDGFAPSLPRVLSGLGNSCEVGQHHGVQGLGDGDDQWQGRGSVKRWIY